MKVLVFGDSILDIYIKGAVERVNPEAPCLILDEVSHEEVLGGAANVAANIRTLSKDPDLEIDYFGFASSKFVKMLEAFSISFVGIACREQDMLIKTRHVSDGHHLLRVDKNKSFNKELCLVAEKMIKSLDFNEYDLIIVSDYNKGTLDACHDTILNLSTKKIMDLKVNRNYFFGGCSDFNSSIIKCNQKEFNSLFAFEEMINSRWYLVGPAGFVVTKGSDGFSVLSNSFKQDSVDDWKEHRSIKLEKGSIDVVGAGDTFLAGMAVSYLETLQFDPEKVAIFGNLCAGVKVCSFGTKAVRRSEVDKIHGN